MNQSSLTIADSVIKNTMLLVTVNLKNAESKIVSPLNQSLNLL